MRITAGKHRNRILKSLSGDNTRPTTDKVKEAVFSKLGTYFDGGYILDLFGGSGAIALEAISRGYDKALIVEKSRQACSIIRENVSLLKESDNVEIWNCSYQTALEKCREDNKQFDLIYVDPPYSFRSGMEITAIIDKYDLLRDNGILVIETSREEEVADAEKLIKEKEALYGITKITYMRKEK